MDELLGDVGSDPSAHQIALELHATEAVVVVDIDLEGSFWSHAVHVADVEFGIALVVGFFGGEGLVFSDFDFHVGVRGFGTTAKRAEVFVIEVRGVYLTPTGGKLVSPPETGIPTTSAGLGGPDFERLYGDFEEFDGKRRGRCRSRGLFGGGRRCCWWCGWGLGRGEGEQQKPEPKDRKEFEFRLHGYSPKRWMF